VPRRISVQTVAIGQITIDAREAHHLRDVLRLPRGTAVEVFDRTGKIGLGHLERVDSVVMVLVESILAEPARRGSLVIAAAVPKAARADWMVEKLCEIGVDVWIPLATERSVALPEGKNKLQRWERLASEAAKQSHRRGMMRIDPLTSLATAITNITDPAHAWCLSTASDARPLHEITTASHAETTTLFVGPEGGWSDSETALFIAAGIQSVSLMTSILRIETAAIASAVVFRMRLDVPAPKV
jgi:16S rRNA (uracil1498-N3)-methyltransferase